MHKMKQESKKETIMKTVRLLAVFFIGMILVSCGGPGGRPPGPAAEKGAEYVSGEEAILKEFKHYIQVQGIVESDNFVLVPPEVSGIVKKICVKEGDRVNSGQLLIELSSDIYEASLDALKKNLELQTAIYQRRERLWEKKIGSEVEYLEAKYAKENLEKEVQTAEEEFKQTRIVSPIDGTIDDILVKKGESATMGVGAVRILNLSGLKITAGLSEQYINRVKKGNDVLASVPIIDKEYSLKIDNVSQFIDEDNRTFEVEISTPIEEDVLKPNMMVILKINDYSNPEALTVPQRVVQKINSEKFLLVAVAAEGQWLARKRHVKTGISYQNRIEITEGLSEGEMVITEGAENLVEGQPVVFEGSGSVDPAENGKGNVS